MAYILVPYFETTYIFLWSIFTFERKNTTCGKMPPAGIELTTYDSFNIRLIIWVKIYFNGQAFCAPDNFSSFRVPRQPYIPSHWATGYMEYYGEKLHENLVVRTTTLKYLNAMEYTLLFCGKMHKKSIISGLNKIIELFSTRYKVFISQELTGSCLKPTENWASYYSNHPKNAILLKVLSPINSGNELSSPIHFGQSCLDPTHYWT